MLLLKVIKDKKEIKMENNKSRPNLGLAGYFEIEKIKDDKVIKKYEFHNLILDCGIAAWYNTSINTLTVRCHLGADSTTAPEATQTALVDEITHYDTSTYSVTGQYSTGLIVYNQITRVFTLPIGYIVGTVGEIGLSTTGNVFLNRAFILDENGDPTTVTLAIDEQLRITAKIRIYSDLTLGSYSSPPTTFLFDGVEHSMTRSIYSYSGDAWQGGTYNVAARTMSEFSVMLALGDHILPTTTSTETYVEGSNELIKTFTWSAVSCSGTITLLQITTIPGYANSRCTYQYLNVSPSIPKLNTEEITFTVKRTWGRYVE
jgi:hypothetical protein